VEGVEEGRLITYVVHPARMGLAKPRTIAIQ